MEKIFQGAHLDKNRNTPHSANGVISKGIDDLISEKKKVFMLIKIYRKISTQKRDLPSRFQRFLFHLLPVNLVITFINITKSLFKRVKMNLKTVINHLTYQVMNALL